MGLFNDSTYRRGMRQLSIWGLPERGALGPIETPALLPRAVELFDIPEVDALHLLARDTGLPLSAVQRVWRASGGADIRPKVNVTALSNLRT